MKNEISVAYSFDDNYAKYAGISILSLLSNNKEIECLTIYILGENLSSDSIAKLKTVADGFQRDIVFLDINDVLPKMSVTPAFGKSAYGRLFLSDHVKADKIFYFDSDTIVSGSIKELLDVEMKDYLVAGIQDTVNPYYIEPIGLNKADRYINSGGVLIINLQLWKKLEVEQKCVDFIQKFDGNPPHNDQGTINSLCKGKITILHPKYNLMNPMFMFSADKLKNLFRMDSYYSQRQLEEAIDSPVVIHYTSEFFNRPWFKNCTHPLKSVFLNYMLQSPWSIELRYKELSKNCLIQNWVYDKLPFFFYRSMIRYIELKHSIFNRIA